MSKPTPSRNATARRFDFDYYRTLLATLCANFEVAPLARAPELVGGDTPVAFLRHDVDVSVADALELARVEHELGVRSTYMVLPDTPLYDLEDERDRLAAIADLGHEIGLHYDLGDGPTPVGSDSPGPDGLRPAEREAIHRGRRRLEALGLGPVRSVSFHQPDERVLEGPRTIGGLINAYSEELMASYISDSGGRWREGSPIESIEAAAPERPMQVLTHPVWWAETHAQPLDRLLGVLDAYETVPEAVATELISLCSRHEAAIRRHLG